MIERSTIIALGWLGKALYLILQDQGKLVSGSYCHNPKGLKNEFHYNVVQPNLPTQVLQSNLIILNLTPSSFLDFETFSNFIDKIKDKKIIFISSTSVYGMQGIVDEETIPLPESENGKFLLRCEQYIINNVKNYKIIRPAGLYGKNRHPAKFLSGRKELKGQNLPINLVSRKDLIKIIITVMEISDSLIINAVNKEHPAKKDFYESVCKKNNLPLPHFKNIDETQHKIITTKYSQFEISHSLEKEIEIS